jgi:hypothetical protein
MKELVRTFLRHFSIALAWGVIFLTVFFVASFGIKQQVKEAIQYTIRTSVGEVAIVVTDPFITAGLKQNIKEGIEFTATTFRQQIKDFLTDPEIREAMRKEMDMRKDTFKK